MNEKLQAMIIDIADKHPNDIDTAVDKVAARLRTTKFGVPILPDDGEYLLRRGIRVVIHDHRHLQNLQMRQHAVNNIKPVKKKTGIVAKSAGAATKISSQMTMNYFSYKIMGRTLGKIRGCELPGIRARINASIRGQQVDGYVIDCLIKIVPPEKLIEDAVPHAQIYKLFHDGQK